MIICAPVLCSSSFCLNLKYAPRSSRPERALCPPTSSLQRHKIRPEVSNKTERQVLNVNHSLHLNTRVRAAKYRCTTFLINAFQSFLKSLGVFDLKKLLRPIKAGHWSLVLFTFYQELFVVSQRQKTGPRMLCCLSARCLEQRLHTFLVCRSCVWLSVPNSVEEKALTFT